MTLMTLSTRGRLHTSGERQWVCSKPETVPRLSYGGAPTTKGPPQKGRNLCPSVALSPFTRRRGSSLIEGSLR